MTIITLVAKTMLDARAPSAIASTIGPILTENGGKAHLLEALDGRALRFEFAEAHPNRPLPALRAALESATSGWEMDVFLRPAHAGPPRLLIADMDSTMITVECIDELADFAGHRDAVSAITERAMRGELDFAQALAARVALLTGLAESTIGDVLRERVRLSPGAATLVQTLRAHGAEALLVSGGFTHFADPVANALGFNRAIANRLEIQNGKLTGKVLPPIVDAATKAWVLTRWCADHKADVRDCVAIGDGANDAPMLSLAGLGIAYRAKPAARAVAGGAITYGDLSAVLYAFDWPSASWTFSARDRF